MADPIADSARDIPGPTPEAIAAFPPPPIVTPQTQRCSTCLRGIQFRHFRAPGDGWCVCGVPWKPTYGNGPRAFDAAHMTPEQTDALQAQMAEVYRSAAQPSPDCIACRAGADALLASPEPRSGALTPGEEIVAIVNDLAAGRRRPGASPYVMLPMGQDDAVGDGLRLSSLSSGLGVPRASAPEMAEKKLAALLRARLAPPLSLRRCARTYVASDDSGEPTEVIKVDIEKAAPSGIAPFVVGNELEAEYVELLDLSGDLEGLADELVRGVRVALLNEGELMRPDDVDWLGSSGALHVQRVTKGQV